MRTWISLIALVGACSQPTAPPPAVPAPEAPRADAAIAAAAPVPPPELPLDDHAIAVGRDFGCARTRAGHVACWGRLPSGTVPSAIELPGLADIAGIAAADGRMLAWTRDGAAWEWTTGAPTKLPITDVIELAGGADGATCARRRTGAVACWLARAPAEVLPQADAIAVAAHEACARAGGDVTCWTIEAGAPAAYAPAHGATALVGYSRGSTGATFAAVVAGRGVVWSEPDGKAYPVAPASGATAIALGDEDVCALGSDAWCWDDMKQPIVRHHPELAGARALAVGMWNGCAVQPDRTVACWGPVGDAGDGEPERREQPIEVPGIDDAVQLGASGETFCVRRKGGTIACWGTRLTDDRDHKRTRIVDLQPRAVDGITDATDVAVGGAEGCALHRSGPVACWGNHGNHFMPRAVNDPTEAWQRSDAPVDSWAGGWFRGDVGCARDAHRKITCEMTWHSHGEDETGPLDLGTETRDVIAMQLPIRQEIEQACIARKSGAVECGDVMSGGTFAPVPEAEGARGFGEGPPLSATEMAATCAVTGAHRVVCWSFNDPPKTLALPGGTDDAVAVEGNDLAACVLRASGHVACWGAGDFLGASARATRETAVRVVGVAL